MAERGWAVGRVHSFNGKERQGKSKCAEGAGKGKNRFSFFHYSGCVKKQEKSKGFHHPRPSNLHRHSSAPHLNVNPAIFSPSPPIRGETEKEARNCEDPAPPGQILKIVSTFFREIGANDCRHHPPGSFPQNVLSAFGKEETFLSFFLFI